MKNKHYFKFSYSKWRFRIDWLRFRNDKKGDFDVIFHIELGIGELANIFSHDKYFIFSFEALSFNKLESENIKHTYTKLVKKVL